MTHMKIEFHPQDEHGNVFTLLKPVRVRGFRVPAGFKSDGASVPRFLWRLLFPPTDSRAVRASVIHDYLYRNHRENFPKYLADIIFYHELINGGIPKFQAWLAYQGVRIFGHHSWKKGAPHE